MTVYLRPHLPLNISVKSLLENKISYLENVIKGHVNNQPEDIVVIFETSQEQFLRNLSAVKNPTLSMGFEVNYELRLEEKSLKLVGNTPYLGKELPSWASLIGRWCFQNFLITSSVFVDIIH